MATQKGDEKDKEMEAREKEVRDAVREAVDRSFSPSKSKEFKGGSVSSVSGADKSRAIGNLRDVAEGRGSGGGRSGDDDPAIPANMLQDARLKRQETLTVGAAADAARVKGLADDAEAAAEAAYKGSKLYGGVGTMLGGPLVGSLSNVVGNAVARQAAGAAARKKAFDDNNMVEGRGGGGLLGRDPEGSNREPAKTVAPVASETETTVAPAPAKPEPVNEFTTKARKKKGYLSTILGGGVGGGYPQGKTLLGG